MTSVKVIVRKTKGGPGSGNWGHSGIPGQVGGSAPGGGSSTSPQSDATQIVRKYDIMREASWITDEGFKSLKENLGDTSTKIRYKGKGLVASAGNLQRIYKKRFSNSDVDGHYVVPKAGEFKGVPMRVSSYGKQEGSRITNWMVSPLLKTGKFATSISIRLPSEDI